MPQHVSRMKQLLSVPAYDLQRVIPVKAAVQKVKQSMSVGTCLLDRNIAGGNQPGWTAPLETREFVPVRLKGSCYSPC